MPPLIIQMAGARMRFPGWCPHSGIENNLISSDLSVKLSFDTSPTVSASRIIQAGFVGFTLEPESAALTTPVNGQPIRYRATPERSRAGSLPTGLTPRLKHPVPRRKRRRQTDAWHGLALIEGKGNQYAAKASHGQGLPEGLARCQIGRQKRG